MKRKLLIAFMVLIALLALAAPAFAGGWVVVTLDALPGDVRLGETVPLSFVARQHGQTPADFLEPTLVARNLDTGETLRATAEKAEGAGRYAASLTFPSEGQWTVTITAAPFDQETQVDLAVLPAEAGATATSPAATLLPVIRGMGLALLALAGLLLWSEQRQRPAAAAADRA